MYELHVELALVSLLWVLAYKGWYHIWKEEYVSATVCLMAVGGVLMFLVQGRLGDMLILYAEVNGYSINVVHAVFGALFTLSSGLLALLGANLED